MAKFLTFSRPKNNDYAVLKFFYDRMCDAYMTVEVHEKTYNYKTAEYEEKFAYSGNINQVWNYLIERDFYPVPGSPALWAKSNRPVKKIA